MKIDPCAGRISNVAFFGCKTTSVSAGSCCTRQLLKGFLRRGALHAPCALLHDLRALLHAHSSHSVGHLANISKGLIPSCKSEKENLKTHKLAQFIIFVCICDTPRSLPQAVMRTGCKAVPRTQAEGLASLFCSTKISPWAGCNFCRPPLDGGIFRLQNAICFGWIGERGRRL